VRDALAVNGENSRVKVQNVRGDSSAFLDGVNVGSLALMADVTWQLARTSLVDIVTIILGAASLVVLLRLRLNSAWLVLIGAGAGLLVTAVHHGL
jgi:chromate transporter